MIKFGTGGWRAIIGDEFTKDNIQKLSKALANKMKEEGLQDFNMVIGYDRRFLSKEAMQWAAQVFAKEGIRTYLIYKSAPTPLIMFYVMKHKLPYGMMITASHNPAVYNGIKVFTYGGRDADEAQTKDIESYIDKIKNVVEDMNYEEAVNNGLITEINPFNEYIDSIIEKIDIERIKARNLRVALDPLYGVSLKPLQTILLTARCDVEILHGGHDTLFGGKLPAPTQDTVKVLQNYVLDYKFDIGIATDGDADRVGVIDDKGRYLHPNDILVILYYYLVKYKGWKGPAVRNIVTTHMLDKLAKSFGQECYEVPVGFKYVSSKMHETKAIIGGESSGGLMVKGHINGKDGIYAASLLVEMLAVTDKKLSEIVDEIRENYGYLYMEERDYNLANEAQKNALYKKIIQEEQMPNFGKKIIKISHKDGCKIYFEDGGWISARLSGTEPLLRMASEMPSKKEASELCDIYQEFLGICS
ncbi:phosphoglucomutase/phosphomannomutase family protein [Tepidanaerobacter syntrophicus]|uniref:phosphoglucomutase/phosphomannomutase family protein n=1 Tax=Tepidanaerobacter syntrophicus TaxID=224999 RepID=UPI001BD43320|nr:phosphoglucomutase/phosphomannomutase family protein [Tepidanaerobacter syntrophicus]